MKRSRVNLDSSELVSARPVDWNEYMSTDWEALYQAGETGWDKGAPAPALVQSLAGTPLRGRVLVPGCGRGHDVRAIAAAGADEVVGLDLAPSAIRDATRLGGHRIRYVLGDLFSLPEKFEGGFDAMFEHTCFCAIPRERRDEYVEVAASVIRPGGQLLGIFYLNPRDDPDPSHGPPFNATVEELNARFSRYFDVLSSEVPVVAYEGREGREVLRRLRRTAKVVG